MFQDEKRNEMMLSFLENEHFRYACDKNASAKINELDLRNGFLLTSNTPRTPLISQMAKDFTTFMSKCMNSKISQQQGSGLPIISFSLSGHGGTHNDESFSFTVGRDGIFVGASHERGLLHASHYIERRFAFRRAAIIQYGTINKKPVFSPRISQSVFTSAKDELTSPITATDKYLSLMSHFGINGIHLFCNIWDYCRNKSIPELNNPEYAKNITLLKKFCERTAKFGIDVYLQVNNATFPADAKLFRKRPKTRGAPLYYDMPEERYSLCSSSKDVLSCYNETFHNLSKAVLELGGFILIVGGEGFKHCFTRPKPPLHGKTSCPNCAGRNPSRDVANMINGIAGAVHEANANAKVFTWPYSAFTWSGEKDFAQTEFIGYLNNDVSLLSNFETPHTVRFGKAKAALIDYNIVNIGPSRQFAEQSKALDKKQMPHYAKFEATTEAGWFSFPYLPLHYRFAQRMQSLTKNKVAGMVAQWRFYCFNGSLPEEIFYEYSWDKRNDADSLLSKIAQRDFGKSEKKLLEGWKILSETWEKIPASHLLYGERQFYMKGPLYIGPAHPLIFDAQNRYGLLNKFFSVQGCAGEELTKEELEEIEKNAPPRYVSDCLFAYPFGIDVLEKSFQKALVEWKKGISLISRSIGKSPRAKMELGICEIPGIHLRSTLNVIRFYKIRDSLFHDTGNEKILRSKIQKLKEIINDEIENASDSLKVLENDFRIGYGYSYSIAYDMEMVKDKIRQCLFVRDKELPKMQSDIIFHINGKYSIS